MKKVKELLQELSAKKEEARSLMKDNKIAETESKMVEVRELQKKIEIQKELDELEEREAGEEIEERKKGEESRSKGVTDIEFRAIGKWLLLRSGADNAPKLTDEERASTNISNSGAILPQAFVNQVQVLTKGFPALKQYCHVIPVTTNTGKMPISKGSTTRKLANLQTDTELVKEMITTEPINFSVADYGKIYPVENSVLEDAGVGFFNELLAPDVAECSVNTENAEILALIKDNATAFVATDYKGIIKCLNTKIVPSLLGRTIIVTNQDGYDYLDQLTDGEGKSILNDSLTVEGAKILKGRLIVVMDNADLTPVTAGKLPFYVVNPYALVKFFDRKQYEIAVSKEAGFTLNQTFARVIERFDTAKGDTRADFYIEF